MNGIDTWRAQIAQSLTDVARHISPEQPFDIGLLTVGIAWPIREAAHHDAQVFTALKHIVGDDAAQVRAIVCDWSDDQQAAAQATSAAASQSEALYAALQRLAAFFGAAELLSARIVEQISPGAGATVFLGAIKAALLNIGGTVNIASLNIQLPVDPVAQAAAQQRAAIELLNSMPLDHVPPVAPLPAHSRVGYSANLLFVGREDELTTLAKHMKTGATTVIAATTGIGGIGKTQLASEFAHRYGRFFAGGVFWLSFADKSGVSAEIAACGAAMALAGFDALDVPTQVARVQHAWQEPLPRLLVFDNCEDEVLLRDYRPRTGGCRVLVTSRRQRWASDLAVQQIKLAILPRHESVVLLRGFLPNPMIADGDLAALAAELGDLPLALHVAGSYLQRYHRAETPATYIAQLRSEPLQAFALRVAGETPTRHERDVALTFAVSHNKLDARQPADVLALALLARLAHFAPGLPVPRDLLVLTVPDEQDKKLIVDALERLLELGLAEEETNDALQLHRLIAAYILRSSLKKEVRGFSLLVNTFFSWLQRSISQTMRFPWTAASKPLPFKQALNVAADDRAQSSVEQAMITTASQLNDAELPARLLTLQPHLRYVTEATMTREDERAAKLCLNLAEHLKQVADYAGAQRYCERILAVNEKISGPNHFNTAQSLNNLGILLKAQGDFAGAWLYYERALTINELALGPTHPYTATSLNNLGGLLLTQGDYTGAKAFFERALDINEVALGPTHPSIALILNNLGGLLQAQGDYAGAKPFYKRALDINEVALGPIHPTTANSLHNLAVLLNDQGHFVEALTLMRRALAIAQNTLGPTHPDTQSSAQILAVIEQGVQATGLSPGPAEIAAALVSGSAEDMAILAERLEEGAQQAEANEAQGLLWLDLAMYVRKLKGYLELAVRAEQHVARLVEGGEAERSEYAARFSTAAATYDGGDAAAQALAARLRALAAVLNR